MMLNAERRGKSSRRVVFTFTKNYIYWSWHLYWLILILIDIDMNECWLGVRLILTSSTWNRLHTLASVEQLTREWLSEQCLIHLSIIFIIISWNTLFHKYYHYHYLYLYHHYRWFPKHLLKSSSTAKVIKRQCSPGSAWIAPDKCHTCKIEASGSVCGKVLRPQSGTWRVALMSSRLASWPSECCCCCQFWESAEGGSMLIALSSDRLYFPLDSKLTKLECRSGYLG